MDRSEMDMMEKNLDKLFSSSTSSQHQNQHHHDHTCITHKCNKNHTYLPTVIVIRIDHKRNTNGKCNYFLPQM